MFNNVCFLIKINVLKDINMVKLEYAANSPSAWIAYDKGISRYGFKIKVLKYAKSQPERFKICFKFCFILYIYLLLFLNYRAIELNTGIIVSRMKSI